MQHQQDPDLLGAVAVRLRRLVAAAVSSHGQNHLAEHACATLASGVLASAADLDLLAQPIRQERGRARRMQLELFDARFALAEARAELVRLQGCEREARQRALEDGLTALPNQGAFRSHLSHNVEHAALARSSLAVLYLDLDNFKLINDAHGHDVGDMLLRIVAVRLRSALRRGDIVGRLGGDEFACLLVNSPSRQALTRRVTKLEQTLMAPVQVGDLVLQVRASVGIALWPEDGHTGDDLLRNADRAMYAAKRQRCGQALFHQDLAIAAAPSAAEMNHRAHH